MKIAKKGIKYILVFAATATLLAGLLVLSALVPGSAIRKNIKTSAEYLCEGELFGLAIEDVKGSEIDRYADSILLAIAYQYDSAHPLKSVMESSYYYTPYMNENENLLHAVAEGEKANRQYLRYWHGSIAVVRPMLTCLTLKQIYIVNGVVMAVLVICLMTVLIRNKAYVPAAGTLTGLVMTAAWFVPLSLEYTWTYLLMLLMSILVIWLTTHGREHCLGLCFLVCGMVTNYMDFLTTETLTLTVPMLLVMWTDLRRNGNRAGYHPLKKAGQETLAWICGYVGMWLAKWLMAALVLHENVMPYVTEHIGERLDGDIGIGTWSYISGVLLRNLSCLIPFDYGVTGVFAGLFFSVLVIYVGYVYHKEKIDKAHAFLYMLPGLVPYIRYVVLHNHSWLHCFFTYRAQLATVLATALILEEVIDWRWLPHAKR